MPQRALGPTNLLDDITGAYESVYGDEKTRLRRSIKHRRLEEEIKKSGVKPFDLEEVGGMSPVMGVTKYISPSGVPSRFGRMVGTETYKLMMDKIGLGEVGKEFAQRYPRIAAHISPEEIVGDIEAHGGKLQGRTYMGEAFKGNSKTIPVGLSRRANDARETMAHEGTHVAQRLGMGKKAEDAYQAAHKEFGYDLNPFEMSARNAASRYSIPGGRALLPPTTINNVMDEAKFLAEKSGKSGQGMSIGNYFKSLFSR